MRSPERILPRETPRATSHKPGLRIIPSERHIQQLLLADVVVGAQTPVVQEARERGPVIEAIIRCLRQLAGRRFVYGRDDQPAQEFIQRVASMFVPLRRALLRRAFFQIPEILEAVEPADQP